MKRLVWLSLLSIIIIVLDQISKDYVQNHFYLGESVKVIDGFFNFTFVKNKGAAFGFGGGNSDIFRLIFFKILPVFACFWLVFAAWQNHKKNLLLAVAYSMVFAGAVGNLIDRIGLNYVVDFFDFYILDHHFAVFNVADSSISIAAGMLILDYFIQLKLEKKQKITNQT